MPYDPEDPYAAESIGLDFGDGTVTAGPTVHGGDDLDLPLSHSYLDDGTYSASAFTGSPEDRHRTTPLPHKVLCAERGLPA